MKLALFAAVGDKGITPSDIYYLASLKKAVDEVIVITGSALQEKNVSSLKDVGIAGYCLAPNAGTSLQQWAFALTSPENLNLIKGADEILFCTGDVYGPFYPLCRLWANKLTEKCDAWGLLEKEEFIEDRPNEFFVVKRRAAESSAFLAYWDSVRKSGAEELKKGFAHLGKHLKGNGFDVRYLTDERFSRLCNTPEILLADDLLAAGYPFLSRSVFRLSTESLLSDTNASQGRKAFRYIESRTDYPLELIVRDLAQNLENSDIIERLGLAYVLPDSVAPECGSGKQQSSLTDRAESRESPKCALIIFTFYEDLFERNLRIIAQIPTDFRIVIVTSNDILYGRWQETAKKSRNIEVRKQMNRGRNESCYWVTCRDVIESSDFICLMHDKKTNYWGGQSVRGYTYAYNAINSLVKSQYYIRNIVDLFEKNSFLGLLMPFPPMFCGLDCVISDPWSSNKAIARKLYKDLGLSVPFDMCPRSPWGGMFWIRGSAMSSLLRKKWYFSDFPSEPVQPDGTVLHALERMYPMIAQDAGYLSAFICPSSEFGGVYFNTYSMLKTKDGEFRRLKSAVKAESAGHAGAEQSGSESGSASKADAVSGSTAPDDALLRKKSLYGLIAFRCRNFLIKRQLRHERQNLLCFFSRRTDVWDSGYYLKANPDVANEGIDPLRHYLETGWREGRSPSASCSTAAYLSVNPDCRLLDISPAEHYYLNCKKRMLFLSFADLKEYAAVHGLETLRKSAKFDREYFLRKYKKEYGHIPDGFDPYSYYLEHGASDALKPSAHFRVHSYLDMFPELRDCGICPVVHYELIGKYL